MEWRTAFERRVNSGCSQPYPWNGTVGSWWMEAMYLHSNKSPEVSGLWKPKQEHSFLLRSLFRQTTSSPPPCSHPPQRAASEPRRQTCVTALTTPLGDSCVGRWGHREFDFVWIVFLGPGFASPSRVWRWSSGFPSPWRSVWAHPWEGDLKCTSFGKKVTPQRPGRNLFSREQRWNQEWGTIPTSAFTHSPLLCAGYSGRGEYADE